MDLAAFTQKDRQLRGYSYRQLLELFRLNSMFHITLCSLPALSYKDSTFGTCFHPLVAWITAPVGFSCIFTNMLLLPFLMSSNLAAHQIHGSHPYSLDSVDASLYCLPVSGGPERPESRQIVLHLLQMTCLFVLRTWGCLFILKIHDFVRVCVRTDSCLLAFSAPR